MKTLGAAAGAASFSMHTGAQRKDVSIALARRAEAEKSSLLACTRAPGAGCLRAGIRRKFVKEFISIYEKRRDF